MRSPDKYIFVLIILLFSFSILQAESKSRYSREEFLTCDNDHDISYFMALNATEVTAKPNGLLTTEPDRVWLYWTATGDDNLLGRATGYDIRYRRAVYGPIDTESKWQYSTQVSGEPTPSACGRRDSMLVTGLTPGESYYFGIKAYDDVGNYSGLSNSPLKTLPTGGYTLSVTTSGSGSVDIFPEKDYYNSNEVVFLYAQADNEWVFSRWTGSVYSAQNPIMIYMNGSYWITGNFISQSDFIPGDPNGDGNITNADVVFLVQYFRGEGMPPVVYLAGDCNGDCIVAGQDVTFLINYFRSIGPAPYAGNCGSTILSTDDSPSRENQNK